MNIALIFPRLKYGEHSPPLGLGYLAAVLEQNRHRVNIVDLTFEKNFDFLSRQLKDLNPEIVGITCQTTFADDAFKAAKTAKHLLPKAMVIIGGPHPTIMPESALKQSEADIAVIGEGENTLLDIVSRMEKGKDPFAVDGIAYRQGEEVVLTKERGFIEDLDTIAFPSRHLFAKEYREFPEVTMISSRGCPYNCSFCQPTLKKLFGTKVRLRSPENVIAEIKSLIDGYPGKIIRFHDDTLTWDKKWITRVCELIKHNRLEFSWNCKSRIDVLDREMIRLLRDSGCVRLDLGVESGSARLLESVLNKGITIEKIKEIFAVCEQEKMPSLAFIMVGAPTETPRDILDTIELLEQISFDGLHVSLFTPFPGTYIYGQAEKCGLLCAQSWSGYDFYSNVSLKMEHFTDSQIKSIKETIQMGATADNIFRKENGPLGFMFKHPRTFMKYFPYWIKMKKLKKWLVNKQKGIKKER